MSRQRRKRYSPIPAIPPPPGARGIRRMAGIGEVPITRVADRGGAHATHACFANAVRTPKRASGTVEQGETR